MNLVPKIRLAKFVLGGLIASVFGAVHAAGQDASPNLQETRQTENSQAKQNETPPQKEGTERTPSSTSESSATKELTTQPTKSTGFVSTRQVDDFLGSLGDVSRDAGRGDKNVSKALRNVLNIRMPRVDEHCDIKVAYNLLKIGYSVQAEHPGSIAQLRRTAESLTRMGTRDFQGVTPKCRAELKAFGASVLRVYLGEDWNFEDEKRLEDAIKHEIERAKGDNKPQPQRDEQ